MAPQPDRDHKTQIRRHKTQIRRWGTLIFPTSSADWLGRRLTSPLGHSAYRLRSVVAKQSLSSRRRVATERPFWLSG
jgi:hypothetical protein